eukprot:6066924-Amphidinium_carterae.1
MHMIQHTQKPPKLSDGRAKRKPKGKTEAEQKPPAQKRSENVDTLILDSTVRSNDQTKTHKT